MKRPTSGADWPRSCVMHSDSVRAIIVIIMPSRDGHFPTALVRYNGLYVGASTVLKSLGRGDTLHR